MNLFIHDADVKLVVDEDLDTNILIFVSESNHLSIQVCIYLEDDPLLNEPYLEYNNQGNAQYGGIKKITLHSSSVEIMFVESNLFMRIYSNITIYTKLPIGRELVEFLINCLFLSNLIIYGNDFDLSNVVKQTSTRERL